MPINRGSHISAVIDEVKHLNPSSILDVGCGWGLMGVLFRAYTDIRLSELDKTRYHRVGYETTIEGIEIFERYKDYLWHYCYDWVYMGDAIEILNSHMHLRQYDLIYIGDIIEHFTKEKGHELLQKALAKGKVVIVATPSPAPAQGETLGNKYEEHLSSWDESDFSGYQHEIIGSFGGILCVRLTS